MTRTRHIIQEIAAMPREQIEHDLLEARHDKQRIEAQISDLTREREQLTMEEQLLSQVLRMHRWADQGVPGAREMIEANAAVAPEAKRINISANVLSLVRQADGRPVTPAEIGDQLAAHGIAADQNAIRVALRRWADRGEIAKEGRVYRAPTAAEKLDPLGSPEMNPGAGVQTLLPNRVTEAPGRGGDLSPPGAP